MDMNNINKKCFLLLALFLPLHQALQAQQDSTLNRTVVVENEYNPDVPDASKINVLPKVEEPAVAKKDIEYATALRPISTWTYEHMPPVTRTWATDKAQRGYLRAGYGNYGNADFKAGYVWDLTKNDRLQAAVSVDGMNGTLKDWNDADWHARSYATNFRLGYAHDFSGVTLDLGGSFGSQAFNYLTASEETDRTDKQHHTSGDFHVGVSSRDATRPVQFRLQTGWEYFGVKYPQGTSAGTAGGKEEIIHTEADAWSRPGESGYFGVRFGMDNLFYSAEDPMDSYTSLALNPYYAMENAHWRLRLGIRFNWQSGTGSDMDIAPDVKIDYTFSDSYVFYVHALGGRELNHFRRLHAFSPYGSLTDPIVPTNVPVNATLGFKASPANGFWFHLFGGYRIAHDELACAPSFADGLYYTYFLQEKAKTAYGGAELKYDYKDIFSTSLKGTYFHWETTGADKELFLACKPEFEWNFHAEAKVTEGLKIHAGYDYVQRPGYAIGQGDAAYDPNNVHNLYAGADYAFWESLSVFGRVNNLLNKRYYHASGYPAEKLHVLFGLSLKF